MVPHRLIAYSSKSMKLLQKVEGVLPLVDPVCPEYPLSIVHA